MAMYMSKFDANTSMLFLKKKKNSADRKKNKIIE